MPYDKYNSPKKKKESLISKTKKKLASVFGPGHSPAGKKYIASAAARGMKMKKGKVVKTIATTGVEKRLRKAGLTEAEIKSLR
ncbi:MAG: hypothetical protein V3T88_01650 [Nitrosomonadaceae bacterium]